MLYIIHIFRSLWIRSSITPAVFHLIWVRNQTEIKMTHDVRVIVSFISRLVLSDQSNDKHTRAHDGLGGCRDCPKVSCVALDVVVIGRFHKNHATLHYTETYLSSSRVGAPVRAPLPTSSPLPMTNRCRKKTWQEKRRSNS